MAIPSTSGDGLWDTVPWQAFPPSPGREESTLQAWHKHHVPYISGANALQNLDIWIPVKHTDSASTSSTSGAPDDISRRPGIWIVYIHGGAWRDPLVTSSSFTPTIENIFKSHGSVLSKVAGFASINYTLSPYPDHETLPSPPKDPSQPVDPSRVGRHPDHIVDVLRGLSYLQNRAGFGDNYVLLGHSCGATLTFQVLEDISKWSRGAATSHLNVVKPKTVVGLNGLYDLPTLIRDAGEKHARWSKIYEEFIRSAFGDEEKVWYDASPIAVQDWVSEWGRKDGKVVLVQSKEDSLVPYRQLQDFLSAWRNAQVQGVDVVEVAASGDHDELWEIGDRLAEIVVEVVNEV